MDKKTPNAHSLSAQINLRKDIRWQPAPPLTASLPCLRVVVARSADTSMSLARNDMLTTGDSRAPRARRSCYVDEPAFGFFVAGSTNKQMNGLYIRRNVPSPCPREHGIILYCARSHRHTAPHAHTHAVAAGRRARTPHAHTATRTHRRPQTSTWTLGGRCC